MYFVATPEKPKYEDAVHHGSKLLETFDWASREAKKQGVPMDVRNARTGRIHANYAADGSNYPIREA